MFTLNLVSILWQRAEQILSPQHKFYLFKDQVISVPTLDRVDAALDLELFFFVKKFDYHAQNKLYEQITDIILQFSELYTLLSTSEHTKQRLSNFFEINRHDLVNEKLLEVGKNLSNCFNELYQIVLSDAPLLMRATGTSVAKFSLPNSALMRFKWGQHLSCRGNVPTHAWTPRADYLDLNIKVFNEAINEAHGLLGQQLSNLEELATLVKGLAEMNTSDLQMQQFVRNLADKADTLFEQIKALPPVDGLNEKPTQLDRRGHHTASPAVVAFIA